MSEHKIVTIGERLQEAMAEAVRGITELHQRLAEETPYIDKRLGEFDKEMIEFIRAIPSMNAIGKKLAFSTLILAQKGWYFSYWDTPIAGITRSAAMFERGEVDAADAALATHIESLIPAMRLHVVNRLSKRLQILDDAVEAHHAGKFTLSIPVFLAQADGIGAELFGVDSIYTRSKDGIVQLKKAIHAKTFDHMENDYFYLVASLMPINASFKRRLLYLDGLNRNGVLHGESTDYPSYINSCKALSWLQYIIWIRQHCDMLEDIKMNESSGQP